MENLTRLQRLRVEYGAAGVDVSDVDDDPFRQFDRWLSEAIEAGIDEPNAFVLATVDSDGRPSARALLLKGFDDGAFCFFTNYGSKKASDIETNPSVSMCFVWPAIHRQVRIDGVAARVSAEESDTYYASRPLDARIGAHASPQSREIADRRWLEDRVVEMAARLGDDPPRPDEWGGYRVAPHAFEFWQGRPSRLHDRIRYSGADGRWRRARLAP